MQDNDVFCIFFTPVKVDKNFIYDMTNANVRQRFADRGGNKFDIYIYYTYLILMIL